MNFEELLESQNGLSMRKEKMPFGLLYRKMNNKKYENVIDLRDELRNSLTFCDALRSGAQESQEKGGDYHLKYRVMSDSSGIYGVALEHGKSHTLQHLMEDNPSVIAGKNFLPDTIKSLMAAADELHANGKYYVCFAPSNLLVNSSDNSVYLLFNGSDYTRMHDYRMLYEGCEEYVAPEVLEGEEITPASDVYSLGMLIKYLYHEGTMPIEMRRVVSKATQPDASKRYQQVSDMRKAMTGLRSLRIGLLTVLGAAAAALLCLYVFDSLTPKPEAIEYVKPAPRQADLDDPLASSLPEDYELALMDYARDSLAKVNAVADSAVEQREITDKEMTAKAEEIFRRHFTKEAERILSTVYTNDRMNISEEAYLAANQQAMRDLVKAQVQIAQRAGLNDTRAQRVAGEIIERISTKKMQQLNARKGGTAPVTSPTTPSTSVTPPTTTTTPTQTQGTSTTTEPTRHDIVKQQRRREEIDKLMEQNRIKSE